MRRMVAYVVGVALAAAVVVPLQAAPAQAYCTFGPTYTWPSKSVTASGSVYWNPVTEDFINDSVQAWTAVTPSPLAYGQVTWYTSIPAQVPGLKLVHGRFSGDDAAPGYASGALNANHSGVSVYFSTYSSRWSWSNTAHGPWHASGLVNVDIRTVAIHEVGHAGGLAHPGDCSGTVTAAELAGVMTAQWTAPRRSLGSDDKAGLNYIGY